MIKKLDHLVITTAKPADCIAFYTALGFKVKDSGNRFELFAGDFKINVHIKGQELEPKAKNVQTGSADLCFELNCTMNKCLQILKQNNIKTELGIVPRNGVKGPMQSVYLRDPDENLVELSFYE